MKTHQEIRDAIELAGNGVAWKGDYSSRQIVAILHALNDRIEAVANQCGKEFAATHDRITSESARAHQRDAREGMVPIEVVTAMVATGRPHLDMQGLRCPCPQCAAYDALAALLETP